MEWWEIVPLLENFLYVTNSPLLNKIAFQEIPTKNYRQKVISTYFKIITILMHSWKYVISTNTIFHCILGFSIFFFFFFFYFFMLNRYKSCHLLTNQWFIKSTTRFSIKEVIFFLFYLSLAIHDATWHARVGSFYASKPLLQYTRFRYNFWFFSPEFPKKKYMKFLDLPEKYWSFSPSHILSFGFQL